MSPSQEPEESDLAAELERGLAAEASPSPIGAEERGIPATELFELLSDISALPGGRFEAFAAASESRQLVKKITRHWTKTTVKSVFNAIYGAHPPLEYLPAASGPSVRAPAPPIGPPSLLPAASQSGGMPPTMSTASGLTSTGVVALTPAPAGTSKRPTTAASTLARSSSRLAGPASGETTSTLIGLGTNSPPSAATTSPPAPETTSAPPARPVSRAPTRTSSRIPTRRTPAGNSSRIPASTVTTSAPPATATSTRTAAANDAPQADNAPPLNATTTRFPGFRSRHRVRSPQHSLPNPDHETQTPSRSATEMRKRKRVVEPPLPLPGDRASKRQSTNTSTNPEFEAGSPSALDQVELDLIEYPNGVRSANTANFTMNVVLQAAFTNPEVLINAVELLSKISTGTSTNIDPTTIPLALARSGDNLFPNLLAASCRANAHLKELDGTVWATRLKTIMSYIILFLTLEHAIVPQLKAEYPSETNKWIEGVKYQRFAEMLLASDPSLAASGPKIRSHVQYGRSFWEYGQALGVASLLVFAVSETGLSKIGGASRSGIPEIAAMLTTSDTWWAFAHAIGPATFRTLFGACDTAYTVPQLLNSIRSQPLSGTTIKAFNEAYERMQLEFPLRGIQQLPTEPSENENWQIIIDGDALPIQRHPKTLVSKKVVRRNLGNWLKNTPGEDVVVDAHGNNTPFSAFKTLLPPNDISNLLVDFLSNVFNQKAISGRLALTYGELAAFGGNFKEFLSACKRKNGTEPQRIVCPYDTETATIGIAISAIDSTVIAYNWRGEEPTQADSILMELRTKFREVHWMTANAPIGEAEVVATKRESTLRYLNFICQEVTGSRGPRRPECISIDGILEAVTVEAYKQVLSESWRVVPARFFRVLESEGTTGSAPI